MSVSVGPLSPPRGEDLPYDDGEPMESPRHRRQLSLLCATLTEHWADRQDAYVGGNMAIYFSEAQARTNDFRAPDLFVVLHAAPRPRRSWVVWEEGGRGPDLVLELLSPSTEAADRGVKMDVYARLLRVPVYVLYDPFTSLLEGFALEAGRYVPIARDGDGRLPCAPLGLSLGVAGGTYEGETAPWLRWFEGGRMLMHGMELAAAERLRTAAERERAEVAEARAARAEAELVELRRGRGLG